MSLNTNGSHSRGQESIWTNESGEEDDIDYEPTPRAEDADEDVQLFISQLLEQVEDDDEAEQGFSSTDIDTREEDGIPTETEHTRDTSIDRAQNIALIQRARVLRLLASSEIGRYFIGTANDDNDYARFGLRQRRGRAQPDPNRFPKVPSDEGMRLMNSGNFGAGEMQLARSMKKRKILARRVLDRELGLWTGPGQKINQRMMTQDMIPSSKADIVVQYDEPVYSGQFSDDGNFFFACVKDFRVRMYDTSNPYRWRYYKTVDYPFGQWTLTDATLTPDNKYLAYTSIQPKVCLAPTDPNDMGDPYTLDLSDNGGRPGQGRLLSRHQSFGIWSIRFSGDGRELVAGTTANSIVIYDIESRRSVLEIPGHDEDVNAVCFGDVSSPHIVYSGSDDTTLKVWDRRSMGDSREAGAFVGHTEGLTYIDSKGDGRYILSNGKDQTMKLWDLRMVMSTARFAQIDTREYSTGFEYRWGTYNEDDYTPHPYDNSLITFRGHKVLRTLIRCHFSPPGSTNSRYVYSGSEDGKVYVYNLDATLAAKVDVLEASRDSRPLGQPSTLRRILRGEPDSHRSDWRACVRDASWHPYVPIIAASSLNGSDMGSGSVTVHSWNDGAEDDEGEPKMGVRVDDRLLHTERFAGG